ncbi:ATP-binding protein [Variovorax dokdonensis]|uniref:ATP-binding protein n=1 Tax=Variovorax dokdonensis TaxID=344883 RepID=A0ABT7NH50_9BURK|nr:ATP-binding protein [Variovorax dokdonensis]MDM0047264.1 ATP-binding protein [Variovorax dokdonensis]
MKKFGVSAILATALLAGCGSMSPAPDTPTRTVDGVLIGPSGMTLYTFARDTAGKSTCNAQCATNWPPLMAPAGAKPMGGYSVIARDDGKAQWAYKGAPLYYWSKDMKTGDRTGDGMLQGAWKVARP